MLLSQVRAESDLYLRYSYAYYTPSRPTGRFYSMHLERLHNISITQIFDSRGNPTVEVDLYTQNGG